MLMATMVTRRVSTLSPTELLKNSEKPPWVSPRPPRMVLPRTLSSET